MSLQPSEFQPEQRGPLHGVRVLDLSRLMAGNMLTLQLADFGAEVIKVEPPVVGDGAVARSDRQFRVRWLRSSTPGALPRRCSTRGTSAWRERSASIPSRWKS